MNKQIKKSVLLMLLAVNTISRSAFDLIDAVSNMGKNNLYTLLGAMVAVRLSGCLSECEYNDKGDYRLVGDSEYSALADIGNTLAMGAGWTVVENMKDGSRNVTLGDNLEKTLINAACVWITKQIAEQDVYKSVDRNHFALRGWLPWNVKLDDTTKKILVFGLTKSLVNKARTHVNIPAGLALGQ